MRARCRTATTLLPALLCFGLGLVAPTIAEAVPEAICVPFAPSAPSLPHYSYSGASIRLKGIARGDATEYSWDFGDGSPATAWTPITDAYVLEASHTYTGLVGQTFLATLLVRNAVGDLDQDSYPVKLHDVSDPGDPVHEQVRINMAIDEGLWWLHKTMIRNTFPAGSPGYGQPYGYWSDGYPTAATCTAVDAFQLHGSKANGDHAGDPYVETTRLALNFMLSNTYAFDIGLQPAGDPDTRDNDIGLVTNESSALRDHRQTYIGGICMVTFATSGAPNRIAQVGRAYVYGETFADIVQDMVDFFAWGQNESGWARGGWRYYANYGSSDMSTAQWPPLGMLAAEENMGSTVPQFVRDELELYLDWSQTTSCHSDNGGFRYDGSRTWYNCTKTAAGIIGHEFLGTPLTDPRVQAAIGFLYTHWNDSGTGWDHTRLHGNSYGMYGVMKAMRLPEPDVERVVDFDCATGSQTANSFDWYYTPTGQTQQGLATYTVGTQQPDGSWDDTVGSNAVANAFATGWRILVLLKGVVIQPPEAVICHCDEQEYNLGQDVNLDATCSYHPDARRTIVSFDWDLDDDAQFDDASGAGATIVGGFPAAGLYDVAVRVTDDRPDGLGGPQTDIAYCTVDVHPPPHCPHAFAGGPYLGFIGVPLTLDATASWDPDNEIVSYEWDLDADGLYGAEDADTFGESSDAVGPLPQWTWSAPFFGAIGLRVTDAAGEFAACTDYDFASVEIGNHTPVADAGGPYLTCSDCTTRLRGTGSYDIDPGDGIVYAWDLDDDGEFDDGTEASPTFSTTGPLGTQLSVCLRVTDLFGEYDIDCTTVEIAAFSMDPIFSLARNQFGMTVDGGATLVHQGCYESAGGISQLVPPWVNTRHGLDALDVEPSGEVLFSVYRTGFVTFTGGSMTLRHDEIYAYDPFLDVITEVPDWSDWGLDVGTLDALDRMPDGTIAFSTISTRFVAYPGGTITLRKENVYRFDPFTGAFELLFDGKDFGLSNVDGIHVLDADRIAFSIESNRFVTTASGGMTLRHQNVYLYDGGEVTMLMDGQGMALQTLDALSLGLAATP